MKKWRGDGWGKWRTEGWIEVSIKRWTWFTKWKWKFILEMRRGMLKRAICDLKGRGGRRTSIDIGKFQSNLSVIVKCHCCVDQLEIEDIAPLKKLRVGHNGKGRRSDWHLEKVNSDCLSAWQNLAYESLHCVSKKVPTFKLSVTLSNCNRFLKFLHCWKAHAICYKTHTTLPTSP